MGTDPEATMSVNTPSHSTPTELHRTQSDPVQQNRLRRTNSAAQKLDREATQKELRIHIKTLFVLLDEGDGTQGSVANQQIEMAEVSGKLDGHELQERIPEFWSCGQDPQNIPASYDINGWVQQWAAYMKVTDHTVCKDLIYELLAACLDEKFTKQVLRDSNDGAGPKTVKNTTLTLKGSKTEELIRDLWLILDTDDDMLQELEIMLLNGEAFKGVFKDLDKNGDRVVDKEEWEGWWEEKLKQWGSAATEFRVEQAIKRASAMKAHFVLAQKEVSGGALSEKFEAAEALLQAEEQDRTKELMCCGAVSAAIAAGAIGLTIWFTRR